MSEDDKDDVIDVTDQKIERGFDRDVDYGPMKESLIKEIKELYPKLFKRKPYLVTISNKLMYCIISIIQLRNGSRISEAINAFRLFLQNGANNLDSKVTVKVGKTGGIKTKTTKNITITTTKDGVKTKTISKGKEKYHSKIRHRKMMFPKSWLTKAFDIDTDKIIIELFDHFKKERQDYIDDCKMRKRVLGYMLKHHDSNTHSLRYAFINFMIYVEKEPLTTVAKFVGHTNVSQLVTYTQQKRCDDIFAKDI